MGKSFIVPNRFLVTRIIKVGFVLGIFLLAGCASRRLVPLPGGGLINPELQSATKTEQGITVMVQTSAWRGKPSDLEDYVTSFYVMIQNDTNSSLTFGYEDLALFDENRTQYNPLPPETVANILQAAYQGIYVYRPYFGSVFIGSGFYYFYPFYFYPFYPWWDFPIYYPERLDDVFTQALSPGLVYPKARLQGFIYFKKIPPQIKRVMLEIGYKVEGEPKRHKLSFPFANEK